MPSGKILYTQFNTYLTNYIQLNGEQTVLQIKELAKNYCIQSRNGLYDIIARKRYYYLFMNYLHHNNLEFPGWDIFFTSPYDPDNEFPNDPQVIRLNRKEDMKLRASLMRNNLENTD